MKANGPGRVATQAATAPKKVLAVIREGAGALLGGCSSQLEREAKAKDPEHY